MIFDSIFAQVNGEERPKKNFGRSVTSSVSKRIDKRVSILNELNLIESYKRCKELVVEAGFKKEMAWQEMVSVDQLTESYFLQEHAWVTLVAGMKEMVVRNLFQEFSKIFFNWQSADTIIENENSCRELALEVFGNKNKINAIILTSRIISKYGFKLIKESIIENPERVLRKFPYIGPITYYHLAKNIGLPVAKPDRHLSRLASGLGFSDVQTLCGYVSKKTGDSIPVVDIVLWRYATITGDYVTKFIQLSKP